MVEDKQMNDEVNEILWGKKKTKEPGNGHSAPHDEREVAEELLFGKKKAKDSDAGKIVVPTKQAKEEYDIVTDIWMGEKKKKPATETKSAEGEASEPPKKKANRDDYFGL